MSTPPITIAQLPDDLLAHVLRFATDAARRDSGPTPCTALADWRYASVSTSFRRAFLRNVSSLYLKGPPAKALADDNWQPLDPCHSIRRFHIPLGTDLTDKNLYQLFSRFNDVQRPIRHIDITFDRGVTPAALIRLATTFGPDLTHLAVRIPFNRRHFPRRELTPAQNPFHPLTHLIHTPLTTTGPQYPAEDIPQQPLLPDPHLQQDAALIQILGGHPQAQNEGPAQDDDAMMPAPLSPPPNPQPLQGQVDGTDEAPMDIAHVMSEVHHALFNVLQTIDADPTHDNAQHPANNNPAPVAPHGSNAHSNHGNPAGIPAGTPQPQPNGSHTAHPPPDHMDVHSAEPPAPAPTHPPPDPAASSSAAANPVNPSALPGPADVANLVHSTNQLPPLLPSVHLPLTGAVPYIPNLQFNVGEASFEGSHSVPQQRNNVYDMPLTDDLLASALSRMPSMKVFLLQRAARITKTGIMPLTRMTGLESLTLMGCARIRDVPFKHILSSLTKLRSLHLEQMPLIGNSTISALCSAPLKYTIRKLHFTRMSRISDRSIRHLVNSCENLEQVHIADCSNVTSETASHLSCALRLKHIFFKPAQDLSISNRTSIHLSCAASTVQSVELMGCEKLSLDGIVALGNLPSLRKLHLSGLKYVSQDVMRQLGVFPKLDTLLLAGNMYLTDLGVKVLCGQRGHRFLYLSLIDRTKNLTDEALDCIMTWCISLRGLEIFGSFKTGAMERLREFIPNATITVCSECDGTQHSVGKGGVWDPVIRGPHQTLV